LISLIDRSSSLEGAMKAIFVPFGLPWDVLSAYEI